MRKKNTSIYKVGDFYPNPTVNYTIPSFPLNINSGNKHILQVSVPLSDVKGIVYKTSDGGKSGYAFSKRLKVSGVEPKLWFVSGQGASIADLEMTDRKNGRANMMVMINKVGEDQMRKSYPGFFMAQYELNGYGTLLTSETEKKIWYIPAINETNELMRIFHQSDFLDSRLKMLGTENYPMNYNYWSSTEDGKKNAWRTTSSIVGVVSNSKENKSIFRAICEF